VGEIRIRWDEENLYHLLVERADRGILVAEVEEVLLDPATKVVRWHLDGRWDRIGVTRAARPLQVRGLGVFELYPETAWPVSRREWQRWQ
jgi:hypothetical protein